MEPDRAGAGENALFAALIAIAVDGIIVTDEGGIVRIYNQACERLFGYRSEDIVGRSVSLLMPQPYRTEHDLYLARYRATGEKRIIGTGREAVARHRDGATFPIYISVAEGHLDGVRIFVGVVHDICERKAREKRIEELQRGLQHVAQWSAMGHLAGAIAHELNQPLTACLNYANAAQQTLSSLDGDIASLARTATAKAAQQIAHAGEIIRRLREFLDKREQSRAPVAINHIVEEAIALASIGAAIPIHSELAPDLPPVLADRVQLQQVLINLISNAMDAVATVANPKVRIVTSRRSDGAVQVSVVDNGPAVSEDTWRSLFQPFVTTKPNGTGMGLSVCRTIVNSHGGRIWAEPAREGGMIFRFVLPTRDDPQATPA